MLSKIIILTSLVISFNIFAERSCERKAELLGKSYIVGNGLVSGEITRLSMSNLINTTQGSYWQEYKATFYIKTSNGEKKVVTLNFESPFICDSLVVTGL